MTISILLADDHEIVRRGLHALLSQEPEVVVVAETGDGLEALQLVERLKPDIVVVDLMMPGLTGLEMIHQIRQRSPKTQAIVLSMYNNEAYISKAFENGAAGYVVKDAESSRLLDAIQAAMRGDRYLSPPLTFERIEQYRQKMQRASGDPFHALTNREREVFHLVAQGYTTAQIAERLFISPRTAEVHRAHMMHKLGLESQTDLIRLAIRHNILSDLQ